MVNILWKVWCNIGSMILGRNVLGEWYYIILYEVDSRIDSLSGPQQNSWCTIGFDPWAALFKAMPSSSESAVFVSGVSTYLPCFLLYTTYGKCPIYLVDLGSELGMERLSFLQIRKRFSCRCDVAGWWLQDLWSGGVVVRKTEFLWDLTWSFPRQPEWFFQSRSRKPELVGGLEHVDYFSIYIYIGNNNPTWLLYFSEG